MPTSLDLEKQKIAERLEALEKVMLSTERTIMTIGEQNRQLYIRVFGDPTSNPPIKGHNARIEILENVENNRDKNKRELTKTLLGSVTISVGAAMLWVFKILHDVLIQKGH